MAGKNQGQERRQFQRIDYNIPVKLSQEDGDIVTETSNVSRSGVYCKVSKYIEPMTKMQVQLMLPLRKAGKQRAKNITCQGVVVRTEPLSGEDYNVAVFFNDISQRDAESIADYISTQLEDRTEKN